MHEVFLKDALRDLIKDNKETLLKGLESQGQARQIAHLTTSILTPPKAYFFIAFHCEEAIESSADSRNRQTQRPPRNVRYEMLIHFEDQAIPDNTDEELYETADNNFDLLGNRVAKLIEEQNWIGSGPKFRLERTVDGGSDRIIRKSNLPKLWFDEAEQYAPMLTSQLRFTLVQECVDNSVLYP